MLDIKQLLEEVKASPYKEITIKAPHCGVVSFSKDLDIDSKVTGPHGAWKEKKGTILASINREHNDKNIYSQEKGSILSINKELEGTYVEAGTELMRIRHFLSKDEVVSLILKKALHLFYAPENAKYYFVPSVDIKVKVSDSKNVMIQNGMEIFIVSRMKREMPLCYNGPDGVIYAVYFTNNQNIEAGQPLIGVCPPSQVADIEDVVLRIQTEWQEGE
ncbi:biotin/lipoyl-containing protein [Desulfovibrio litoralis]|uniref:Uncharacterized protein n=1 Tax=Desulfovibrio litoralis DSM 11393 TaxID=1121455 RepID=A0A1M7SZ97_9BACT|nr:biotin/lipoyl-containing protein [Desulfovibrio litoralis]SHN63802.1 hypothetical protein SAMN02745728_01408 [Desulfovibrio litoralis DSM 11393]